MHTIENDTIREIDGRFDSYKCECPLLLRYQRLRRSRQRRGSFSTSNPALLTSLTRRDVKMGSASGVGMEIYISKDTVEYNRKQ